MPLRLTSIKFRAGSSAGQQPLEIICPNVTVLIGPNNSGKSQTLREIENECCIENSSAQPSVIESISLGLPATSVEIMTMLTPFNQGTPPGQPVAQLDHIWLHRPSVGGHGNILAQVYQPSYATLLTQTNPKRLNTTFVRFLTRRLDGATRFNLVNNMPTGPLEQAPANHLWALFVDDAARARVSAFTQAAFNRYFVIDPTGMTEFRMRLSDRAPADPLEEQAVDPRARAFHQAAPMVTNLGDGVKASVGLVSAVHSLPDQIILVDEPEAFLHPTLARRMGRVLSETARERDASLVVATHSSEFLVGCLQATNELRLVRLTYEGGIPTARTLAPKDITTLMNDPLLRSANALRALFHRGVIICEADSDRAFYEEINVRLSNARRGIDDALFMNAQNWQTIPRIIRPLRNLGVPAAGIFDLDVLMDDAFRHIWYLIHAGKSELKRLMNERAIVKRLLVAQGRARIKSLGLQALAVNDQRTVQTLLDRFAEHGVFFVPVGELEGWLQVANITRGDKAKWVLRMFEHLGTDPQDAAYVNAGTGDVWDFIGRVKNWLDNPNRRGIPA